MEKTLKKALSVLLAATLTFGCITFTPAFAAGEDTVTPFTDTGLVLVDGDEVEGGVVQDFVENGTEGETGSEAETQTVSTIQGVSVTSGSSLLVYSTDESPTKVTLVEITNKDDIAFVNGAGGADTTDMTAPKIEIAYSFTASEDLGPFFFSGTVPVKLTSSGDNKDNYCFYTVSEQIVDGVSTEMWTPVNETEIKRNDAIRISEQDSIPFVYAGKVFFGLKAGQTAATGDDVTITISPNLDTTGIIDSTNLIIATGGEPLTELTLNGIFFDQLENYQGNGPEFSHGQTSDRQTSSVTPYRQRLQAVKKPYYSNEQVRWTIEGTSDDLTTAAAAAAKYELYDARTGGNKINWNTETTVTDVYIGIVDGQTINARDNADEVTITVTSAVTSSLTADCLVKVSPPDFRTIGGTFKVYDNGSTRDLTDDETVFLYVVDSAEKTEPQYREIKKPQGIGSAIYELNLQNPLSEHIIQVNIDNMLLINKDETAILDGNTWIGVPYDDMRDPDNNENEGDFKFVELPKLKGKVVDKSGNGISGVSVYGPSTATTDASGSFEMYLPLETFTYARDDMQLGVWKNGYYLDYSVNGNGAYDIPALPEANDLVDTLKSGGADINVGNIVLAQEMIMPIPNPPQSPPPNPFEDYEKNSLRLYPGELSSAQYATAIAYMHNSGNTLTNFSMKIEPMWADLDIKMSAGDVLYFYELPSYTTTMINCTRERGFYGDVINFTIPEFKANTQYMFSFGVSVPARPSGMRIGEIGTVGIVETGYGYGSSEVMLTITDLTLDCPPEVKKGESFEVTGQAISEAGTTLKLSVVDMLTGAETHTDTLAVTKGQSAYKFTVAPWANMDSGVYEIVVSAWKGAEAIGGTIGYVRVAPDPVVVTSAGYYDNMVRVGSIPNPSPDLIFPVHVWMLDEYNLDSTKAPFNIEVGLQSVIKPLSDVPDENGGEITDVTIGIQTRFGEFTYPAAKQSSSESSGKKDSTWKATLNELSGVGISGVYAYVTQKSYTQRDELFVNKIKVMNLSQIVDPSGYVYNASTNVRIKDAEATLYYKVGANWEMWPAEKYQQINPQKTDEDGRYGWMVPEGDYEVRVTKMGYANYTTLNDAKYGVITVLPARTDINIGLTSTSSGDNSDGNKGGVSSSGGDTTPASTVTVPIEINGTVINAALDSNGTLTLTYTEDDIAKYKDDSGELDIEIPEQDKIVLNIPVESVGTDNLSIVTDFGKITIPNETLSELRELFGDTLRLSIIKGSFKVALLDESGNEIPYSNPETPFVITLPYNLKSGQNPGAVVVIKNDKIIPYAIYNNGGAEFIITETGIYDLIYNKKSFNDINGHWANDNITFLAAREMVSGMGDGEFSPNTSMTRAMFVQILADLEGTDLPKYTLSRFSDVLIGEWYSAAIEWAAAQGIVGGVGDGRFDPNANITREQMAVLMVKYFRYKGYALPSKTSAAFADEKGISEWAVEAVKAMQATGIVTGKPGNLFDPQGIATRAEVATIFARFIELAAGGNAAQDANSAESNGQLNALLDDRRKNLIVGKDEKEDA